MNVSQDLKVKQECQVDYIEKLAEKYPFSNSQLGLLLRLESKYINDGQSSLILSSIHQNEKALEWIENNILSDDFFHLMIQVSMKRSACSFYECVSNLTGRKSSPCYSVKVVYELLNANHREFISIMYKMAISTHVIKHFDTINLNDVLKIPMSNIQMIASLESFSCDRNEHLDADQEIISENTLLDWIDLNFPMMFNIPSTFLHYALLEPIKKEQKSHETNRDCDDSIEDYVFDKYALGKRTEFQFPKLEALILKTCPSGDSLPAKVVEGGSRTESMFLYTSEGCNECIGQFAFGLAMMDPNLSCGIFYKLFSTEDGCSFVNMHKSISGYSGPMITIIRPSKSRFAQPEDSSPGLFGFYSSSPWVASKDFYGNSDSFLFRAEPKWSVYRSAKMVHENDQINSTYLSFKENYMYYNPSLGSSVTNFGSNNFTKDGRPKGLILGGSQKDPRLHLTESFEGCIAATGGPFDNTYMSGPLLMVEWDKYFNVDIIEVWAVGGYDIMKNAMNEKLRHDGVVDLVRRRVQRVDKSQFLEDFQNGLVIGSKLFDHKFDEHGGDINCDRGCYD